MKIEARLDSILEGRSEFRSTSVSASNLAKAVGAWVWETPRASFIPAQGNALGSSTQDPISTEGAIHSSSFLPPAGDSVSVSFVRQAVGLSALAKEQIVPYVN